MTDQVRRQVCVGAAVAATVLVDGVVTATWTESRNDDAAALTVQPLRPLSSSDRCAVEAEADRLPAFTNPEVTQRHARLLRFGDGRILHPVST